MGINLKTGKPFHRGAKKSPRHKLLAASPHRVTSSPPPQFAFVPKQLDMWGNDQYGDCVSAEEAFAKACYSPEIFIPTQTVTSWAQAGGFLNGADLTSVMDAMKQAGFVVGQQMYNDGPYTGVDYSNETVLQSALSQGPVKIAIDANALPSGAGNQQGWVGTGGSPGQFGNTDHCVAICGYGPASWLFQQLGIPLPAGLSSGYLLYTWSTIGFVDHAWIMSTCVEAWLRNPTTVGVPPLPGPTPPPVPPTPPSPPSNLAVATLTTSVPPGTYPVLDSTGVSYGTLTVTVTVPPGTYPQGTTPTPTTVGTIQFSLATAAGTYHFPGLGSLSLSSAVTAGETLSFSLPAGR